MSRKGRPKFEPSDKDRAVVKAMTGYGICQDEVARVVGVSDKTLRKHFKAELATAATEANAAVAQSMFQMATKGKQVLAGIFWLKARAGWRETVQVEGPGGAPIALSFRWADAPAPPADPLPDPE